MFGIYCGELDRCFLVPIAIVAGKHMLHLRLSPPRNGQRACINLASSFDFEGAIAQLGERLGGTQEVVGSSPTSSTHAAASVMSARSDRGATSVDHETVGGVSIEQPTMTIGSHTLRQELRRGVDRRPPRAES